MFLAFYVVQLFASTRASGVYPFCSGYPNHDYSKVLRHDPYAENDYQLIFDSIGAPGYAPVTAPQLSQTFYRPPAEESAYYGQDNHRNLDYDGYTDMETEPNQDQYSSGSTQPTAPPYPGEYYDDLADSIVEQPIHTAPFAGPVNNFSVPSTLPKIQVFEIRLPDSLNRPHAMHAMHEQQPKQPIEAPMATNGEEQGSSWNIHNAIDANTFMPFDEGEALERLRVLLDMPSGSTKSEIQVAALETIAARHQIRLPLLSFDLGGGLSAGEFRRKMNSIRRKTGDKPSGREPLGMSYEAAFDLLRGSGEREGYSY